MNILPFILALVLMLSVLTIERLEKFKNQTIVQAEYQIFLKENERHLFNLRQKRLYGKNEPDIKQVSFRYLVDKKAREADKSTADQYRQVVKKLMKILYGEADFFKTMANQRGEEEDKLLDCLLDAVEKAADNAPEKAIRRIEDIVHLHLEDPDLQELWYHMLKGTISREKLKELSSTKSPFKKERAYVSLFHFINYRGAGSNPPRIVLQHAPREVLKVIFENDDVVEEVVIKRNELAAKQTGGTEAFAYAFKGKVKNSEISDQLLDFKITPASDKTPYN